MTSLILIDDDRMTRELIGLIVAQAGYGCTACESGEAALQLLAESELRPFAVVADMQMPGLCGNALALQLRQLCGRETRLVAMSGSPVSAVSLSEFDAFLLKPFNTLDLLSACRNTLHGRPAGSSSIPLLNDAVYTNLSRSMHPEQVKGLYKMCLHDAEARIAAMRTAVRNKDEAAYRRAAHAIRGGCGMVGATELATLAGIMEEEGLSPQGSTRLESFLDASQRLRRMLDCTASGT